MAPPLSVEEQDARLRAECPQFSLVAHNPWVGVWEGTLRPICQTYRVRIIYFARRVFRGFILDNPYVSVVVIDPPIGADRVAPASRRNTSFDWATILTFRASASTTRWRIVGSQANTSSTASSRGRSSGSSSMRSGSPVASGKLEAVTRSCPNARRKTT